MSNQYQEQGVDGMRAKNFWGLGRLLAVSFLLQIGLFAVAGFWGVFYLTSIAFCVMWFCTVFRAVEQPEAQEVFLSPTEPIKVVN
jgi:hypothetical protein